MRLHPTFKKEGARTYVTLPLAEYRRLEEAAEDHRDLMDLRAAEAQAKTRGEKFTPHEQVAAEFGAE